MRWRAGEERQIEIVEIRERPVFKDLFEYAIKKGEENIYAITNSDIIFPTWNSEQFKKLLDIDYDKTSVVLIKWNNCETLSESQRKMSGHIKKWEYGNTYKSEWTEGWSQNTWVFKVPFKDFEKINTEIYIGTVECDCYMKNVILYLYCDTILIYDSSFSIIRPFSLTLFKTQYIY